MEISPATAAGGRPIIAHPHAFVKGFLKNKIKKIAFLQSDLVSFSNGNFYHFWFFITDKSVILDKNSNSLLFP